MGQLCEPERAPAALPAGQDRPPRQELPQAGGERVSLHSAKRIMKLGGFIYDARIQKGLWGIYTVFLVGNLYRVLVLP